MQRKLKAALAWCERINALTPEQRGGPPWHYVLLAENVVYEWQARVRGWQSCWTMRDCGLGQRIVCKPA